MKLVINGCYGGFGLSIKAQRLYCQRKSIPIFFYEQLFDENTHKFRYNRLDGDTRRSLFIHTISQDLGESPSESQINASPVSFYDRDLERNDPLLVQIVEELKSDANGQCASLHIVEIPDGISYEIDEYDGIERVHESHRSWS